MPTQDNQPVSRQQPSVPAPVRDDTPTEWQIGECILDLYEVRSVLGEGGMGKVYKVHHRAWDIDLAVKSPKLALFTRASGKENFIREAETWMDLGLYPHIVSCYYVRTLGGLPRIFAEYVKGGSLADWIRSRRLYEGGHQSALARMLDVAIQFAWGLYFAHEHGLIHQDVKPANVLLTPEGNVKVADFGLAKARFLAGEQGSEEGQKQQSILVSVRGMTPAYCSPEQMAGRGLTRKTDLWSWGVSLLEMFVGDVTWQAGIFAREALANHHPQDSTIPLMPAAVVKLLAHCFQRHPQDRPATMLEIATELQAIYTHEIGQSYPRVMPTGVELQADTLNNRALSLYDLGKVGKALQSWEQALQVDPQHLETTYNRGVLLWRRGELFDDDLVHQLEMVQSQQSRAAYLLAQVHLERGDVEAALPLLEHIAEQPLQEKEVSELLTRARSGTLTSPHCLYTLPDHTNLRAVSISADGCLAVSGSAKQPIQVWETATGQCVNTLRGLDVEFNALSLSHDGRWLAAGGYDGEIAVWESRTGQTLCLLRGHTRYITSVSLSADGRWLFSGSGDKTVRLWEVASGRCIHIFSGHGAPITTVSLSADGRLAASGCGQILITDAHLRDYTVRLWETATGRLRTLSGHTSDIRSVSLSADGRWLLSGSDDKTIRLWETATGQCLHVFREPGTISAVSLSPDGRWCLAATGRAIRLWEVATGRCVRTLEESTGHVRLVSLSADTHRAISGSGDTTVRLWEMGDPRNTFCSFSLSQVLLYTDVRQKETRARHLLEQAEQARLEGHFAMALDCLREVRALPGWEHHPRSLQAWVRLSLYSSRSSCRTAWLVKMFQGHTQQVTSVSLSPDGHWLLSGSGDRTVRLWETATGRCVHTFQGVTGYVNAVSLSRDGRFALAGGADQKIHLWETTTGHCLRTFQMPYHGTVLSLSLSDDGCWLVSVGGGKGALLWETATGRCVRTFQLSDSQAKTVILSRDGRWLISSDHRTIQLWETTTGQCLRTFQGHTDSVRAIALSADGRWLISSGDQKSYVESQQSKDYTVWLWEVITGQCVRTFQGHTDYVYSLDLSADGRWALSGSYDGTVRLWETATGQCVHIFQGHSQLVTSVKLSVDGRWAVSGSWDQSIKLWELDWELETHDLVDWDKGALPYLGTFLTQHTPYAHKLLPDHEPSEQEIQLALTRRGMPVWNEQDFQELLHQLQYAGYGWLRPEGVRSKLEKMARARQNPHP